LARGEDVGQQVAGFLGFSRDGRWVRHTDGSIVFKDPVSDETEKKPYSGARFTAMALEPAGRWLAGVPASGSPALVIYDLDSGQQVKTLPCPSRVAVLAWGPGGRFLAGSWGDCATVWDVRTGKEQSVLRGHESRVTGLAFNYAGDLLAT